MLVVYATVLFADASAVDQLRLLNLIPLSMFTQLSDILTMAKISSVEGAAGFRQII